MTQPAARSISLADGRKLGFGEYGAASGPALFFFHGTPGSRIAGSALDGPARARGVRVIAPERPGYGASDPKPGRSLLDWAADVCALADALGLARFAVAGVSGGGPYAAACAHALPERVKSAAILSGIGPTDEAGAARGMLLPTRFLLWSVRRAPPLARAMVSLMARQVRDPERAIERMARAVPAPDRRLLRDPSLRALLAADFRESLSGGSHGALSDMSLFARPWGFTLSEIRVPVLLWHGELDRNCPVAMGRRVAAAIPGCRATFEPAEAHMFTLGRADEILKAIGL